MNKRQAKKARKKIIYPFIDEMNLLTLNTEELKKARTDFENYVQRHFRYKHYRSKDKLLEKPCYYRFPVVESVRKYYEYSLKTARRYNVTPVIITQAMDELKAMYREEKQLPACIQENKI